jgi:hypothetical protein
MPWSNREVEGKGTVHWWHGENDANEGLICRANEDPVYGVAAATPCRGTGLCEAKQDFEVGNVEEHEVCGLALGGLGPQPGRPAHRRALLALKFVVGDGQAVVRGRSESLCGRGFRGEPERVT